MRNLRNIGAHASAEHISREDARDVLDFAIAICEYVFVPAQKYVAFQERLARPAQKKIDWNVAVKDGKTSVEHLAPIGSATNVKQAGSKGRAETKRNDDEAETIPF